MLKKIFLLPMLLLSFCHANAQMKDNFRLGIEPGFLLFSRSENLSGYFNVEPKIKITKNTFAGLRVNIVLNPQKFKDHDPLQYKINDTYDNGGFSFVPTLDHYFYEKRIGEKFFRPYLGWGVGVYLLTERVDVFSYASLNEFEVKVDKQMGALFRAGLEYGRLRFGLEYNFLRKAAIETQSRQPIGTVNNSYLGLSCGLIVGHKEL